jgi:hypothetical protein
LLGNANLHPRAVGRESEAHPAFGDSVILYLWRNVYSLGQQKIVARSLKRHNVKGGMRFAFPPYRLPSTILS